MERTDMSEASMPHCPDCKQVEYTCQCHVHECDSCGCKLTAEAIECGRSECFDCYVWRHD
jgi:hypothetical protein